MPSPLSLEPDTLCSSETGAKLVGIVTSRDMQFESPETPLHKVMTTSLVTAPQGVT
jgi:predicted transcriptional regulator